MCFALMVLRRVVPFQTPVTEDSLLAYRLRESYFLTSWRSLSVWTD